MFPFYGWGSFQIRLARRRAHPCDEQVAAAICSFCLYIHVKVSDSILWVGPAVETWLERGSRNRKVHLNAKAAIKRRGGEDQARLYIYNGNLLQFSTFASLEVVAGDTDYRMRKSFLCMQK